MGKTWFLLCFDFEFRMWQKISLQKSILNKGWFTLKTALIISLMEEDCILFQNRTVFDGKNFQILGVICYDSTMVDCRNFVLSWQWSVFDVVFSNWWVIFCLWKKTFLSDSLFLGTISRKKTNPTKIKTNICKNTKLISITTHKWKSVVYLYFQCVKRS